MLFSESKWPNGFEGQGQCLSCSIPAVRIPRCIFGANLVILVQIHKKLLRRQAEIPIILSQNSQNDLEGQGQWPPFSIPAESIPGCMFGANLVILAQIYDELLWGQAKFPRILSQNGHNDLEGHGQWPPFSIPADSIPRCMFGTNLVIPAPICDELSYGQGKVYGQTDGQTQATTIPPRPESSRGNKRCPTAHPRRPDNFDLECFFESCCFVFNPSHLVYSITTTN